MCRTISTYSLQNCLAVAKVANTLEWTRQLDLLLPVQITAFTLGPSEVQMENAKVL